MADMSWCHEFQPCQYNYNVSIADIFWSIISTTVWRRYLEPMVNIWYICNILIWVFNDIYKWYSGFFLILVSGSIAKTTTCINHIVFRMLALCQFCMIYLLVEMYFNEDIQILKKKPWPQSETPRSWQRFPLARTETSAWQRLMPRVRSRLTWSPSLPPWPQTSPTLSMENWWRWEYVSYF